MQEKRHESLEKAEEGNFLAMIAQIDHSITNVGYKEGIDDDPTYAEVLSIDEKYANYFVINKQALVDVRFSVETGLEIEREHYVEEELATKMTKTDVDQMFGLKTKLELNELAKEVTDRTKNEVSARHLKLEKVTL